MPRKFYFNIPLLSGGITDALPAAIDALPAIAAEAAGRATIIFDSGVRSGADVAFAGKAFLWSLGALGEQGPLHFINILKEDLRVAMGSLGVLKSPTCARSHGDIPAHGPQATTQLAQPKLFGRRIRM